VHLAGAHLPLDADSERTRAAADVQNFLSWCRLGQLDELSPGRLVPPEGDDCAEKIVLADAPVDDAACRFRGVSALVVHFCASSGEPPKSDLLVRFPISG
jgi:hypothetical protein